VYVCLLININFNLVLIQFYLDCLEVIATQNAWWSLF